MSFEKILSNIEYVLGALSKAGPLEIDWHAVASKHGISNANNRFVKRPFTKLHFVVKSTCANVQRTVWKDATIPTT